MKVKVNPDRCALSGFCESIAPQVFALEPGADTPRVLSSALTDPDELIGEAVREAEATCPTMAIRVTDD